MFPFCCCVSSFSDPNTWWKCFNLKWFHLLRNAYATATDLWRIRDQLDVTSYYVLFHFFYAQHVSDINTSIVHVAGWSSLLHGYHPNPATLKLQHTSQQEHTTNAVAGSCWWMY
jgi:hypothetical protein